MIIQISKWCRRTAENETKSLLFSNENILTEVFIVSACRRKTYLLFYVKDFLLLLRIKFIIWIFDKAFISFQFSLDEDEVECFFKRNDIFCFWLWNLILWETKRNLIDIRSVFQLNSFNYRHVRFKCHVGLSSRKYLVLLLAFDVDEKALNDKDVLPPLLPDIMIYHILECFTNTRSKHYDFVSKDLNSCSQMIHNNDNNNKNNNNN